MVGTNVFYAMADKGQLIWNRPLAKLIGPVRLDIRFYAKHAKKELSRKHEFSRRSQGHSGEVGSTKTRKRRSLWMDSNRILMSYFVFS
jgi:hypothetical protein